MPPSANYGATGSSPLQLRVIGAGWGRTGTMSTKLALERLLGGPCHHMHEVIPKGAGMMAKWYTGFSDAVPLGAPPLEEVMAGYVASVDFPSSLYWRELLRLCPEAKVLITVHPKGMQRWYDSARSTIFHMHIPEDMPFLRRFLIQCVAPLMPMGVMAVWMRAFFSGLVGGAERLSDRDHVIRVHEEWISAVRSSVPKGQLLEWDVSQGWAPLCAFLGVAIPDEPFPRVNEQAEFEQKFKTMDRIAATALALLLAAVGGTAFGVAHALGAPQRVSLGATGGAVVVCIVLILCVLWRRR